MEDVVFIRLSIEHYRALLGTKLDDEARSTVQRLLTEAEGALAGGAKRRAVRPRVRPDTASHRRRMQASIGR